MSAYVDFYSKTEGDSHTWFLALIVSLLLHFIFIAVLVFIPDFKLNKKSTPSVIDVNLVTFSNSKKESKPEKQSLVKTKKLKSRIKKVKTDLKPKVKPEVKYEPKVKQDLTKTASSVQKKVKIKTSLKRETFKSSKIVENALKRIEGKLEKTRPDPLRAAIDRLKNKVHKTGKNRTGQSFEKKETAQGIGKSDEYGHSGIKVLEKINSYRLEIALKVQKNWAFSGQMAGGRNRLVAELAFMVMPNGEIKDIWFDKRSGNSYLDESANRAIMKTNPVDPHPPGVLEPFIIVGLRFTPEGVMK